MNNSTEHILQRNQSDPLADASGRIVDLMIENAATEVFLVSVGGRHTNEIIMYFKGGHFFLSFNIHINGRPNIHLCFDCRIQLHWVPMAKYT